MKDTGLNVSKNDWKLIIGRGVRIKMSWVEKYWKINNQGGGDDYSGLKSRLDASVCNNKQRWNDDTCRCECKELIDKGVCDKRYAWNPSNCKCECGKSCDVGEYLDYENCKC